MVTIEWEPGVSFKAFKRKLVQAVLDANNGNHCKTCRDLRIGRQTLYRMKQRWAEDDAKVEALRRSRDLIALPVGTNHIPNA